MPLLGMMGLVLRRSRRKRCFSPIVAYCLILVSALTLCNAMVQAASNQPFANSTSLSTNTDPGHFGNLTATTTHVTTTETSVQTLHFTVAYSISSLYITVFSVRYTTTTSLFTVVDVQFTSITSYITHVQVTQPNPAPAPSAPTRTFSGSDNSFQHNQPSAPSTSIISSGFFVIDAASIPQFIACVVILLASILLIRRQKK
jgi:hypothetical protein